MNNSDQGFRYFLLHKPLGAVSSRVDNDPPSKDGTARQTVYKLCETAGFPTDCGLVGRLDAQTTGLILFTDDSALNRAITLPVTSDAGVQHSKVYVVTVFGQRSDLFTGSLTDPETVPLNIEALEQELSAPLSFQKGGVTVTAESAGSVKVLRCWKEQYQKRAHTGAFTCDVAITLFEGKHHQIRRLCHRSKLKVKHLHRVSMCGVLHIDSVPQSGQFRWLQADEVEQLRNKFGLCSHDSKYPQCLIK